MRRTAWTLVLAGPALLSAAPALLSAAPARALDCARATTRSEQTICADPAARAADAAMALAFSALIARAIPSQKAASIAAQSEWIVQRDAACSDEKGARFAACLVEQSERRRAFLSGEPEAGPGAPGRLEPFFRFEKGGKGKAAVTLELLKYPAPATPAERAFDAAVDRLVGDLPEPEKDDSERAGFAHTRQMRLIYASPRLLSAQLYGYDDQGGAHPNSFTGAVNIDVEKGREAKFVDLADAEAAGKFFALCTNQVVAQKKRKLEGGDIGDLKQLERSVAEQTARLEAWSFAADSATVTYDAYAVGSYAEGDYDCQIPYAKLKPLAKAGFPLP